MNFFTRYPRFTENDGVNRLSRRWEKLFEANAGIIKFKRILDLGSINGRWTAAALDLGAKRVVGVEGRAESIAQGNEHLAHYEFIPESYKFIHDNITNFLRNTNDQFDTILCMGIFYHINNHAEIFEHLDSPNPCSV